MSSTTILQTKCQVQNITSKNVKYNNITFKSVKYNIITFKNFKFNIIIYKNVAAISHTEKPNTIISLAKMSCITIITYKIVKYLNVNYQSVKYSNMWSWTMPSTKNMKYKKCQAQQCSTEFLPIKMYNIGKYSYFIKRTLFVQTRQISSFCSAWRWGFIPLFIKLSLVLPVVSLWYMLGTIMVGVSIIVNIWKKTFPHSVINKLKLSKRQFLVFMFIGFFCSGN